MPIRVKCGNCKKTLSVKDHLAGKKIKCPVCQTIVVVGAATGQNGTPASQSATAPAKNPIPVGKPAATHGKPAPAAKQSAPVAPPSPPPPEAPPSANAEEEALAVFAENLPAKQEAEATPKTIDFKCEWCEAQISLPIEMAGKKSQCTNAECRRIVKVPLPKVEAKKDWRSMDRRGPAGALISQPEAPKDAWGSQEATRARQASLAQAGAIDLPPKPPIGAAGWIVRGAYVFFGLVIFAVLGTGIYALKSNSDQHRSIGELKKLVEGREAKIAQPVLAAHTYRTIGLMYLASQEKNRAVEAQRYFQGAQTLFPPEYSKENPGVNEQLFLIELALSQIELGSSNEDEVNQKLKRSWEDVRKDLEATLNRIYAPDVQVMAMRQIATRLLERNQPNLALGLSGGLSISDDPGRKPAPAFSQQIALFCLQPDQKEKPKAIPKIPDIEVVPLEDGPARIGYAEGYARKQIFDKAFEMAQVGGPARDRLEANIGVAAILASNPAKKGEALKFIKEALKIVEESEIADEPWLLFFLAQIGVRAIEPNAPDWASLKKVIDGLETPFKNRALLEVFLAKCEKSPGPISADDESLATIEDIEKAADKDGITITLAWFALAEQHAHKGVSRSRIQQTFTKHIGKENVELLREKIRPVLDVGAALGSLR